MSTFVSQETKALVFLPILWITLQQCAVSGQFTLLRIAADGTVNNCTCSDRPWDGLRTLTVRDSCITFLIAEAIAQLTCECEAKTFGEITTLAETSTIKPWWQTEEAYLCCEGSANATEIFHTLLDYSRVGRLHVFGCGNVEPIPVRPFITIYSLNQFTTTTRNFTLDQYYYSNAFDRYKEQHHAAFLSTQLLNDTGSVKAFSFLASEVSDSSALPFELDEALRRAPAINQSYMFTPIYT